MTERQEYLLLCLADWRAGHECHPSNWGEFLGQLNATDAEEQWMLKNEGSA